MIASPEPTGRGSRIGIVGAATALAVAGLAIYHGQSPTSQLYGRTICWRRRATAAKIASNCARARDGDVILLHDGAHSEPAADRGASIAATEATLRRYSAAGYRFVTVPELVGSTPPG